MKRLAFLPLAALTVFAACNDDSKLPVGPNDSSPVPVMPATVLTGGGGGVSGANFTTTNPDFDRKNPNTKLCLHGQDGDDVINCNIYGAKPYVWLNGGPLAAGLESGTYFWAVVAPGGQPDPNDGSAKNLSDDTDLYTNRTFSWDKANGQITYTGTHDFDTQNQKLRVGVKPPRVNRGPDWFADTPNPGGVYILAICRISSPSSYPVNPRDCKYDAFKVKDQPGTPEVMVSITPSVDVNPVGNAHTFNVSVKAVGGKLPYTFEITPSVDPSAALVSHTCGSPTAVDDFIRNCTVTVNSSNVELVTVEVTAKVTDANGNSATSSTGPNNLPNSDHGFKYYVDAQIAITPQTATNGIGEQHMFTVTFTAHPGVTTPTTFNSITYSVSPTPDSESSTCGSPAIVGNVATCTITINHGSAGVFTVNATGSVTMGADQDEDLSNGDGATVIRTTDGSTTSSGLVNSGAAQKTYVPGQINWQKVDEEGLLLGGAEFRAERIADRFSAAIVPSNPIYTDIVDCMASPCAAGLGKDQDPAKGKFKLTGLALGTWRVMETKAPTNYTADLTAYQDMTIDLTNLPASLSASAANNFVNVGKYAGCTPGFWKQEQHFGYWHGSGYSPVDPKSKLSAAFSAFDGQGGYSDDATMLEALDWDNSTGVGQVLRHGVAALLNAHSTGVFYGFQDDPENIQYAVNAVLTSMDRNEIDALHKKLETYNQLGCTLSGQKYW